MLNANTDSDNSSIMDLLSEAPFTKRSGDAIMHRMKATKCVRALIGSFTIKNGISFALGNIIFTVIFVSPCR